jgi:hypothetical protein
MNYGRHAVATVEKLAPEMGLSSVLGWLADAGYWILPKPADFSLLLFEALDADRHFHQLFDLGTLRSAGFFSIELSVLTSLAFTAYLLFASARQFARADY